MAPAVKSKLAAIASAAAPSKTPSSTYTVSLFTSWPSQESWDKLKEFLTGEEGGKLRIVEPREGNLAIVRQVKGTSDFSKPHVPWCRSVVVNKESRLPVSVSPPKADSEYSVFTTEPRVEDFLDGTMLHVFGTAEGTGRATRSRLGANNRVNDEGPTFAEQFEEAVPNAVAPSAGEFQIQVLQHPTNRIVVPVTEASATLIQTGSVAADGTVTINEQAVPSSVTLESLGTDPAAFVRTEGATRGIQWQGIVLRDGKGNRLRYRSEVQETVRRLRGNDTDHFERFARLRKARSLDTQLIFQPEDRTRFQELEGKLRANTRQLLHHQREVFVGRKAPYHELPWPQKHHVSVLHNLQKEHLRPNNKKVDLDEVIRQVNGLSVEDTANLFREPKPKRVEAGAEAVTEVAAEAVVEPAEATA